MPAVHPPEAQQEAHHLGGTSAGFPLLLVLLLTAETRGADLPEGSR